MQNSSDTQNNLPIQFTALLLHDLEAPLAVAKQFIKRVEEGRHDSKNLRHMKLAASALQSIARGERILEDLIDQARNIESGLTLKRSPARLLSIISECIDVVLLLAEDKNLVIQPPSNPALQDPILIDERMISRVIDNLLVNAIRHAPRGSQIRIGGGRIGGRIWVEVANLFDSELEIDIEKIFDPSYQIQMRSQRKMRGSGLGLTFCHTVITAHEGTIAARQEKNTVIYRFELPAERRGGSHG